VIEGGFFFLTMGPAGPGKSEVTMSIVLPNDAGPEWDQLVPNIFADRRFHKSTGSSRRWQVTIGGVRAGFVIALRPDERTNFALNKADLDRLLELLHDGSFSAALVVLATSSGSYDTGDFQRVYIGHRDAEELAEDLKSARLRKGERGDYWLLQEGVTPLEPTNDDIPF
jgi:hypothetical protein